MCFIIVIIEGRQKAKEVTMVVTLAEPILKTKLQAEYVDTESFV